MSLLHPQYAVNHPGASACHVRANTRIALKVLSSLPPRVGVQRSFWCHVLCRKDRAALRPRRASCSTGRGRCDRDRSTSFLCGLTAIGKCLMQSVSFALAPLLCVLSPGVPAAQQIDPQNMRSGQTASNIDGYMYAMVDAVNVPTGAYFVLADFVIELRTVAAGNCFLPVQESGEDKWWSIVHGSANSILVTMPFSLRTGLVFQPGTTAQFFLSNQTASAQTINVNWSGYLVYSGQSSVEPEVHDKEQLGLRCLPTPSGDPASTSFSLSSKGAVTVAVFDVQGRAIRTLHEGELKAGTHSFPWDGRNDGGREVADGAYFARVQTSRVAAAERMIRERQTHPVAPNQSRLSRRDRRASSSRTGASNAWSNRLPAERRNPGLLYASACSVRRRAV